MDRRMAKPDYGCETIYPQSGFAIRRPQNISSTTVLPQRRTEIMWVKICGICDRTTTDRVVDLHPDAIGLNFYAQTPRCIHPQTAAQIVESLPESIEPVGLFVNHSLEEVIDLTEQCSISTAQLHGDETPEFLAELNVRCPELNLLRAFRVGDEGCGAVAEYLAECGTLGVCLAGCLIDARVTGSYGGTGHTAPWDLLADQYDSARWPRLIVAGGLTPDNVAEAIRVTVPYGVDVASGVESAKAVKDLELVKRFIAAARLESSAAKRTPSDG